MKCHRLTVTKKTCAGKSLPRHADDREIVAVQPDDPADDVRVAVEPPLPESVIEHGKWVSPGTPVVLHRKEPPGRGLHPQSGEVIARDQLAPDQFGLVITIFQTDRNAVMNEEAAENVVVVAVVLVIWIRKFARKP